MKPTDLSSRLTFLFFFVWNVSITIERSAMEFGTDTPGEQEINPNDFLKAKTSAC